MGNTRAIVRSISTGIPDVADMQDGELILTTDSKTLYQRIDASTLTIVQKGSADTNTWNYTATTSNYTITALNGVVDVTANTVKITLPTAVGLTGQEFIIKNSGTGVVSVDPDGTETIDGNLTIELEQYDSISIISNNTNWIII